MRSIQDRMADIQTAGQEAMDRLAWIIRNGSGILAGAEMDELEAARIKIARALSGNTETAVKL